MLPPTETGRLADPRAATDLRNGRAVIAMADNERLLCICELRCLHRFRPIPSLMEPNGAR